MENQKFLNTHECGEMLGRTDNAIRRLVMRGIIPYRKIGGKLVFLENELLEFIENSPGKKAEEILNS
jgi:hypothetical protein